MDSRIAVKSTRQQFLKVVLLRSCTRCRGDLFLRVEEEGDEYVCLQCARSLPATAGFDALGTERSIPSMTGARPSGLPEPSSVLKRRLSRIGGA